MALKLALSGPGRYSPTPASIEDDAISIGAEIMFEARTVSVADASEAIILINIEKTKF